MIKPDKTKYKEKVLGHIVYVQFLNDENKLEEVPFDNGEQAKRFVEANDFNLCIIKESKRCCFEKIKEEK